ncbi:hypothetical protein ACIA8K_14365 [Catenuloplanes sp. NPDC051500]|uniref:hypothetical protein n=1 Tax=Catenuloplanes sp. NPDC051500 TaxID=3363959 RepID=UPI0037A115C2
MSSEFTPDDTAVTTDVDTTADEGLGLSDPGLDDPHAATPIDTESDLTAGDDGVLLVEQTLDGSTNVYVDSDGDGFADLIVSDLDSDGTADVISADTDGDGRIDTELYDVDDDGVIDAGVQDTNSDGVADVFMSDTNHDGAPDVVEVDEDYDGEVDYSVRDTDYDGNADEIVIPVAPNTPVNPYAAG